MTRRRYAEKTKVPVERSKVEVERLLRDAGATGFVSGWDETMGVDRLMFRLAERMFRIDVAHPDPSAMKKVDGRGHKLTAAELKKAADMEYRRRWRAQLLLVKAKLEVIADGLSTVEREFLADMVLPDSSTMAETFLPRLVQAYEDGKMNTSLPLLGPGS